MQTFRYPIILLRAIGLTVVLSLNANAASWTLIDLTAINSNDSFSGVLTGDLGFNTNLAGDFIGNGAFASTPFAGANSLYTWNIDQLVISSTGDASANAFSCVEGTFGAIVNANICDNTSEFMNGPALTVNELDGMSPVPSLPGEITLENLDINGSGWRYSMTFEQVAVPAPAAVWLFGSALGLLGWVRRKTA